MDYAVSVELSDVLSHIRDEKSVGGGNMVDAWASDWICRWSVKGRVHCGVWIGWVSLSRVVSDLLARIRTTSVTGMVARLLFSLVSGVTRLVTSYRRNLSIVDLALGRLGILLDVSVLVPGFMNFRVATSRKNVMSDLSSGALN